MVFITGPCDECCFRAWDISEIAIGDGFQRATRHYPYIIAANGVTGSGSVQYYAGPGKQPAAVEYADISGIGTNPTRVGCTSEGHVLLKNSAGDIYEVKPFAPWNIVELRWNASTYVSVALEGGFLYYHTRWGFGTSGQAGGALFSAVFDSAGAKVFDTNDASKPADAILMCTDQAGNAYWRRHISGTNYVAMRNNSDYCSANFQIAQRLIHNGKSLYFGRPGGLMRLPPGGSVTTSTPLSFSTGSQFTPDYYTEALRRMYGYQVHINPPPIGGTSEYWHRIRCNPVTDTFIDNTFMYSANSTGTREKLIEWG